MIRFNNDYNHGAHPAVLAALEKINNESYGGYGQDEWCEKASKEIKKYMDCPQAAVHFLVGGTQANYVVIASALRPYQGVICAESGHIHVHETGAVENSGHKVLALPHTDGKITAQQIRTEAENYRTSVVQEHIVEPKMVYLSYPTEYGTIYSKAELEAIYEVCREYGMYLFIDGARMGYGLAARSADLTLADIAKYTDAFYCGGTKCGLLFGEAVVITNPELQPFFRSYMKQNGALLAKGWLLGIQFYTMFHEGLYFDITRAAVEKAMRIKAAFAEKGIPALIESDTNQQFVILENGQMEKLAENYIFEFEKKIDESHTAVRFCTSWSTSEEEVDALVRDIQKLYFLKTVHADL